MTGTKTNERPGTRAQVRHARFSATKARAVLDIIRGLPVDEAVEVLRFTERSAAERTTLATTFALGVGVNRSMVSACSTGLPRTMSTSGRTLIAGNPVFLTTAFTSTLFSG